MARLAAKPSAQVEFQVKQIIRYLIGTSNRSIEYSPQNEERFRALYSRVAKYDKKEFKEFPDLVGFSD